MINQNHPFHLVFNSPWPIFTGSSVLTMLIGTVNWMCTKSPTMMNMGLLLTIFNTSQWWRDVSRESSYQGYHSNLVMNGLRWGMILFITSEILFFFSFFWSFFHSSLAPNLELGLMWPPLGIAAINPFQVPLLNTSVLLASGVFVTWAHHGLIEQNNKIMNTNMMVTVVMGLYFTSLQAWEYWESSYSMSDSSFGSTFFLATGFHGLHVLVGTIFLLVSLMRHNLNMYSLNHHLGLEASIWYWHFVDVVWLFLYSFLYWWSY
ncbi:cytochrome c oxidase subunit 3 (mitochondrion) [Ramazzottius varieornatus]|uniref:Cytochrome c oxidase subunit 3 n=1 Tax=Ramazzottius varieornatus TaxID=947166 RepID=A0A1C9ZVZ4_RAMVA|nr:cytochrome c oxidase subunit 3 [Ramazzottius varieornatus]BAV58165.1 cytochrome c oxidase subunit 3 [Ramazzottius varieornatus]